MNASTRQVDTVCFAAGIIALGSLFLPFVSLRPNRISSGTPLMIWQVVSPYLVGAGAVLLIAVILLPFIFRHGFNFAPAQGVWGNLLAFLVIFTGGQTAARLSSEADVYARVSLAGGSWLLLVAAYIFIVTALKALGGRKVWTFVTTAAAVLGIAVLVPTGRLNRLSLLQEFFGRQDRFFSELVNHLTLSGVAVAFAVLLGVPLGMLAFRVRQVRKIILWLVNLVQTIPSLALFGLLIAPLSLLSRTVPFLRDLGIQGIGWTPAVLALTIYALLPITRNTYTGLETIDPALREAGRGTGFSPFQLLWRIELPLALPVILAGVRISFVQAIGNTTIAALIGAGGFGVFVFQGFGQAVPDLILLGTLPVIVLAVLADRLFGFFIRMIVPRGLRLRGEEAA